jgi:hypothetical protein
MRRRAGKAIIVSLLALALSAGTAAAHPYRPFVPYGRGATRIAAYGKSVGCFGQVRCKARVRHCNRWERNQISCQIEVLSWGRGADFVTYCHWQALAWKTRRGKPLEVWSEPKPKCTSLHRGVRWPRGMPT